MILPLHDEKTVNRVELNTYQAVNEHTPFRKNVTLALLSLCWYHRGPQKTKIMRRKSDDDYMRRVLDNFDLLCGCMSNGVEKKITCYVNELHSHLHQIETEQGFISDIQLSGLHNQLSCANRNKTHISNYNFIKNQACEEKKYNRE